jgi:hypothetical protein
MNRAGWTLDWVDLDLTGRAPILEIRATRHDGLLVHAYVDQLGRATLERFKRERSSGMPRNKKAGARMPTIPTTARYAYYYARDVIKGRWPEVEAVIATDPEWAYLYALNVVKGRWLEAEATIKTHPA